MITFIVMRKDRRKRPLAHLSKPSDGTITDRVKSAVTKPDSSPELTIRGRIMYIRLKVQTADNRFLEQIQSTLRQTRE